MKAQFLPLFNVNLSQPQLNSTSTQFQLNFNSTSSQPYFNLSLNINLNSTSILSSTQYGCDIKATQPCYIIECKYDNQVEFRSIKLQASKDIGNYEMLRFLRSSI